MIEKKDISLAIIDVLDGHIGENESKIQENNV